MALEQLIHNGVVVPDPPQFMNTRLMIRGQEVTLTPKQEEMALAFARKKDTPYVEDEVFVANFMRDWSAELGYDKPLSLDEIDLAPLHVFVASEKEAKARLSKEEKKAQAAERKAVREALKARYGYAIVNGQRVELGTYMVEPSGIFMGRGQHPLRGRWKEGAHYEDIALNRSPDAPPLDGNWGEILWQPESMWVARWQDKLTGKLKYIWLSDTAPVKQEREARKFDKAIALDAHIDEIRQRIEEGLIAEDAQRRMVATACYLIDTLCLRVGDEKDPDEADTVGATTLRPEHVTILDDGTVEFRFLGKDSVEWHKSLTPPQTVLDNLRWLVAEARPSSASDGNDDDGHPIRNLPQLFPDVTSSHVNAFFSSIMPGLSAKVFRTHHATRAVSASLETSAVTAEDAEYRKWQAASLANYEAALLCNHTKKYNGNWSTASERYVVRIDKARERIARYRDQAKDYRQKLTALRQEAKEKQAEATEKTAAKVRARYRKRTATAQARIQAARERQVRAEQGLGKVQAQYQMADKKRTWNLGTSLKSYIDPRVYHQWGQSVGYDVLDKYYPTTLRRKFAWVRAVVETQEKSSIGIRTCMSSDLVATAHLLALVSRNDPDVEFVHEADEIERRYLPSLQKSWREAVIALGEDDEVVAFAAIGPEWSEEEEENGASFLDIFGVIHPDHRDSRVAEQLAKELAQRLHIYRLNSPHKGLELRPSTTAWFELAPRLVSLLEIEALDEKSEDED